MTERSVFESLNESLRLPEDYDLEYKSAKGGLPSSLWETYSAMANTDGGVIVLGIEDDGTVSGLDDATVIRKRFWDTVNNRNKISINILKNTDVDTHSIRGRVVLSICVPRASRQQRPVHTGLNPLTGTYRRNYEGDYHCSEQEVARMLADRSEEPADSVILDGFGLEDLDEGSLQQYRNRFSARTPSHPWLSEDCRGFLSKLGGWRRDRLKEYEGLTLAGLLMFGKVDVIRSAEAVPAYHLDYREHLSEDATTRWTDRLTVDGTWEANLFQFYQRVVQRLSADLQLPFHLDRDLVRQGETVVHEAIREALANGLIHADYRGEGGVVVEKHRDRFEVSNPGTLLVSLEQLFKGGVSECRNKALQTMFLMIGAAEKAGSGIDKIWQGWRSQHWRSPSIQEQVQPTRVRLVMPMVSLMPEDCLAELRKRFGPDFERLQEEEVKAVVTAHAEAQVSNARMREITNEHPADLTKMLQNLVKQGFLVQDGQKRGATYRLPSATDAAWETASLLPGGLTHKSEGSAHSGDDFSHESGGSAHNKEDSLHNGGDLVQTPTDMESETLVRLRRIALPAHLSARLPPEETRQLILRLCHARYLTAADLGKLLNRNASGLRSRFLKPMVEEGVLRLRYPHAPNRPDQAYAANA